MGKIISIDKSVIPACDVDFKTYKDIVEQTKDIEKIKAYKVGVSFLDIGLKVVADVAKDAGKFVIYDHQKAGTDIPESSPEEFMDSMVRAGVNAVILFPQAGPITQYEWTIAAQERELGVISGGEMTHPRYLEGDTSSGKKKDYNLIFGELGLPNLTGYIRATAPEDMYKLAAKLGVEDFVMPGNKPERIVLYKDIVIAAGVKEPSIYSPGLIAQGGDLGVGADAAGKCFHGIVGRAITKAEDRRQAAIELTSKL